MDRLRLNKILLLSALVLCLALAFGMGAAAADDQNELAEDDFFEEEEEQNSSIIADTSIEDDDDDDFAVMQEDDAIDVGIAVSPPGDSFASDDEIDIWLGAIDDSGEIIEPVEDETLTLTIEDPDGEERVENITTDENGSADFQFDLEDELDGEYDATVENSEGSESADITFNVGPVVDITTSATSVFLNEEATFSALVRDGEFASEDEEVDITVSGPEDEPLVDDSFETDENGFANVSFTPEQAGDYRIDAELSSGEDSSFSSIEASNFSIGSDFSLREAISGEESTWGGYLRSADGQVSDETLNITFAEDREIDDIIQVETATTDDNGFFLVDYDFEVEEDIYISVETEDGESVSARFDRLRMDELPDEEDEEPEPEPEPEISIDDVDVGDTPGFGVTTAPGGDVTVDISATDADEEPITDEEARIGVSWDTIGLEAEGALPFFTETVVLDENGEASVTFEIPENALDDVSPSLQAALDYEDDVLEDSAGFNIEKYHTEFNPGSDAPGEEIDIEWVVEDQLTEEPVEEVPLQYDGMYRQHKGSSLGTDQLVSDEDGEATSSIVLPEDLGLGDPSINHVNRYDTPNSFFSGQATNPGTLYVEGEEFDTVTVSPGDEVEVSFDPETDEAVSGIVFGEASDGLAAASFGTVISSEENTTLTVPEFTGDGEFIDLDVWAADNDDTFYEDRSLGALEVDEPEETTAAFEAPEEAFTGEEVTFDASASTAATGDLTYTWEFGDGTETETDDPVITHTYEDDDEQEVTLTVEDGDGTTDDTTLTVDVSEAAAIDGTLLTADGEPADGLVQFSVTNLDEEESGPFESADLADDGSFEVFFDTEDLSDNAIVSIGYYSPREGDVVDFMEVVEDGTADFQTLESQLPIDEDGLELGERQLPDGHAVDIDVSAPNEQEPAVSVSSTKNGSSFNQAFTATQLQDITASDNDALELNGTVGITVYEEFDEVDNTEEVSIDRDSDILFEQEYEIEEDEELDIPIELEVDEDDISLFDRAPMTVRYGETTPEPATTVSVADVRLKEEGATSESLRRDTAKVFEPGTEVEFNFSEDDFGDSLGLPEHPNEGDVQLVVSKFEEPLDDDRDELESALTLQDTVADGYEVIDDNGEFFEIEDGQVNVNYTADEPGQYIVHFAGIENGTGFTAADDELGLDGSAEVIGIEQLAVQRAGGQISVSDDELVRGDDIDVALDSNLDEFDADLADSGVEHSVLLYDPAKLEERVFTIITEETDFNNISEDDITLRHDIESVSGVVDVDEDLSVFDIMSVELNESSFDGTVSVERLFDELFDSTEEFDRIADELEDETVVLNASANSVGDAGASTELTLETLNDWQAGDYQLLYAAQAEDDLTMMSTATQDIFIDDVEELPNLDVTIDADEEQQLRDGLTADVTVENIGLEPVGEEFDVDLTASGTQFGDESEVEDVITEELDSLDPDESETVTVDFTDFVQADGDDRPDGHVVGDVDLEAAVDPDDEIEQQARADNSDEETVEMTYAKLEANAIAPSFAGEGGDTTLRADVTNIGTGDIDSSTFDIAVTNESGDVVFEADDEEGGSLDAGERNRNRLTAAFDDPEQHNYTLEVTDEFFPGESNISVDQFEVEEYELEIVEDRVRVPDERTAGQNITTLVGFETNIGEEVDVNLSLETEGDTADNITFTDAVGDTDNTTAVDPDRNRVETTRFDVWALEESEVELTFEVEDTLGLDESETITKEMNLTEGAETVSNTSSVAVEGDSTDSDELTVYGSDALPTAQSLSDQEIDLTVQAGADGRTLQGLEYLVQFPFGCVEQTTSAFLGALNTDEYYQDRGEDIDDRFQDRINDSILEGVERVTQGGERGQITEDDDMDEAGAWNQWGPDRGQGQEYFTSYSLFGLASVENFDRQGERDEVDDSLMKADYDAAINWFHRNKDDLFDDPQTDGLGAGDGYLDTDEAVIGFSLIGIDEANQTNRITEQDNLTDIYAEAGDALLEEEDDGSWADEDQRSTAHALHGLKIAYENGAFEEGDKTESDYVDAIEDATTWLVDEQDDDDGQWDEPHRSFGFQETGDISETTSAALLALNESVDEEEFEDDVVLDRSDETITDGVDYLIETYESGGSWGYPRATQAAINTLTVLQPEDDAQTVDITIENGDEELKIDDIEVDASNQIEEVDLTEEFDENELENVLGDGEETEELTVEVDGDVDDNAGVAIAALEVEQDIRTSVLGGDSE